MSYANGRLIHDADAERSDYFREFYQQGWLDPASYDLVLNTDRLTPEQATEVILAAAVRER